MATQQHRSKYAVSMKTLYALAIVRGGKTPPGTVSLVTTTAR